MEKTEIELKRLLHELQVHQVELEVQNQELREAQQMLEESRDQYRELYDSAPVGYVTLDEKGIIKRINYTGVEMLGVDRSRLLEMPFSLYVSRGDVTKFLRHLRLCRGAEEQITTDLYLTKGTDKILVQMSTIPVREAGQSAVFYRTVLADITERRKMEEHIHQMQKMEAVGQLAGGIAHDFNNIISAIVGYASVIEMDIPDDSPLRYHVDQILAATKRASDLTQNILHFSRKQTIKLKSVDLNQVIKDVEGLLAMVVRKDIQLKTILIDEPLTLKADPMQIELVLINLVTNARDAMHEGGVISIETSRVQWDNAFIKSQGYGKPGIYALLSVTDTGIGIDEKIRERIFEPFFTTKSAEKGTGLGLSTVFGIIKRYNGYIDVHSETGKGTTIKIYLRMANVVEPEEKLKPSEVATEAIRGNETVLLAEDDNDIRELAKAFLERSGYRVIDAADGEDALNKFRTNKDEIRLLILDEIMPKKNGNEVCAEIKQMNPDIKVIFTSGYNAATLDEGEMEEGFNFVPKPYSPGELLKKVREVLDKEG